MVKSKWLVFLLLLVLVVPLWFVFKANPLPSRSLHKVDSFDPPIQPHFTSQSTGKSDDLPSRPALIPFYMVEQHGDVFPYWRQHLLSRTSEEQERHPQVNLLHVDSHSDVMDVTLRRSVVKGGHKSIVQHLENSNAEIGDFITRAVYLGWLKAVAWLRSDFTYGFYNEPSIGDWQTKVVMNWKSAEMNLADMQARGRVLNTSELNRLRVQGAVKVEEGGYDIPVRHRLPPDVPFQYSVATLGSVDSVDGFLPPANQPWILDVDLDFFCTDDPCVGHFRRYNMSHTWLHTYMFEVFDCDDSDSDANGVFTVLSRLADMPRVSRKSLQRAFKRAEASCSVYNSTKLQLLWRELRGSAEKASNWKAHWLSYADMAALSRKEKEWSKLQKLREGLASPGDLVQVIGPDANPGVVGFATEEEITANTAKVAQLVRRVVAANGPPLVVTVARSQHYDGYLPPSCARFVQQQTVAMLQRELSSNATMQTRQVGLDRPAEWQLGTLVYHSSVRKEDRE